MLTIYDYVIIVFYFIFIGSIGYIFKKFNKNSDDYFAGGKKMTWWLVGASAFVANFSSWTFTGAAGIAYKFGIVVFIVYLMDVLGFILSYIWFAPKFRRLRLITAMDAVRNRYGRAAEQVFNWIKIPSMLLRASVWLLGISIILSVVFKFPQVPVILVTGVIVTLMALFGGNWSVFASDFIQVVLLISVSLVIGVLTIVAMGGVTPAIQNQLIVDEGILRFLLKFHIKILKCNGR